MGRETSTCSNIPGYIRVIITTDSHGRQRKLLIPAALDLDRPKRPRTTFETYQTNVLESEFHISPFISEDRRIKLANALGLTETQIKVWFQNRRTKAKKMELKACQ